MTLVRGLQEWYPTADDDITVLNVIVQNVSGQPASVEEAGEWKEAFGLTFEVLADSDQVWVETWGDDDGGIFEQHSYTVIDRNGFVTWHREEFNVNRADQIINQVESIP